MDNLKEFFSHINYRISSPLIFSFAISWMICNWQVPISLIFYNQDLLQKEHVETYIQFINANVTTKSGVCLPITFALLYTIFNPIVAAAITAFYTYIQKHSEELNLKILQGSKIGMDKYIKLTTDIRKKNEDLERIIEAESKVRETLSQFQTRNIELESINENLNTDIQRLNNTIKIGTEDILKHHNRIEQLQSNLQFPSTLETIFSDNDWICETQLISSHTQKPKRHLINFIISDKQWIVDGKVESSIQNINLFKERILEFQKKPLKNSSSISTVKLARINETYWFGIENVGPHEIIYVRFYKSTKKPKELLFLKIEKDNYLDLDDRNFLNDYFYTEEIY